YLTYYVMSGGIHRLIVRTGLSGARYLLSLNTIPITAGDAKVLTGNPMLYGQTLTGEILSANPIERYYFVGTANDVVSVHLVRSTGNLLASIQLFSPRGVEVAKDRNTENADKLRIDNYRLDDNGVY